MERNGLKSIGMEYLLGKSNLKRDLLYFDKLVFDEKELEMSSWLVEPLGKTLYGETEFNEIINFQRAELDFLQENKLIFSFDSNLLEREAYKKNLAEFTKYFDEHKKERLLFSYNDVLNLSSIFQSSSNILFGQSDNPSTIYRTYFLSALLNATTEFNSIPILDQFVPEKDLNIGKEYQILEVVLSKFPIIDDNVSWEKILDFKQDPDSKRKFLALRNWMIDISKGNFSAGEISEKLDYLLSEYQFHIQKHKLKTNFGIIKSFIVTTSEILENLIRFKWSEVVKAGFDICEKNSRLAEIQVTAPGKEVGYIYNIQEKLSKK